MIETEFVLSRNKMTKSELHRLGRRLKVVFWPLIYTLWGSVLLFIFFNYSVHQDGGNSSERSQIDGIMADTDMGANIQEKTPEELTTCGKSIPFGPQGLMLTRDMDPFTMEEALFLYIMVPQVQCQRIVRPGRTGDGGWNMCVDDEFVPHYNCIVYSFGISGDWSFDEDISESYQCEVHSFDPSIGKEDHKHSPKIWFHNLGLSGTDGVIRNTWKVKTLKSILEQLKHTNRLVDMVKLDVEGSEWEAIPDMIATGALTNVKQLVFEIHIYKGRRHETPAGLYEVYEFLKSIDDAGFRRFYSHINKRTHYVSKITNQTRYSCIELFYLNSRFLKE